MTLRYKKYMVQFKEEWGKRLCWINNREFTIKTRMGTMAGYIKAVRRNTGYFKDKEARIILIEKKYKEIKKY